MIHSILMAQLMIGLFPPFSFSAAITGFITQEYFFLPQKLPLRPHWAASATSACTGEGIKK